MQKNILEIVPYGGLCNRMRVIASARDIAQQKNYELRIYWEVNKDCNALFNELFQPINKEILTILPVRARDILHLRPRRKNFYLPTLWRLLRWDIKKYSYNTSTTHTGYWHTYFDRQRRKATLKLKPSSIDIKETLVPGKNLIFTCYNLTPTYNCKDLFIPHKEIADQIKARTAFFAQQTIGLHIRRTDHVSSIAHSPIELFYKKIDQALRDNPKVKFFLATDAETVKEDLKTRYPSAILSNKLSLTRASLTGMKGAVVDLYCLSLCHKILGSYTSSYSQIAAHLGELELEIVK